MTSDRPLNIPVILGTVRRGRSTANVARLILAEVAKRENVTTELIDIADVPMPVHDAGEAIKDTNFAARMTAADALVIVTPEYNHSIPGLLKHVLDSCLKEYIHKAAGIVGVSAGPFGGTRMIENFIPILRELGLVPIFYDVNFGNSKKAFDEAGNLLDDSYLRRIDRFLKELIWMATTLRWGRDNLPS